jgi:outer membrane protein TolC
MNASVLVLLALVAAAPEASAQKAEAPRAPAAQVPTPPAPDTSRTLSFQEVLERMESQSLELKAARARLDQARTLSSKAWSGYLPQLSAGASYTRNSTEATLPFVTGYAIRQVAPAPPAEDPNPGLPGAPTQYALVPSAFQEIVVQPANSFGAQVQLNQAVIAPALIVAIRNAGLAGDAAELGVEAARREILFAAAQLYFGAAGLKQAVAVQERLLEVNTARMKDAQIRYEAGTQPKVALLRAQIDLARSEQDLLRARNSYRAVVMSLATLMNEPADFDVVVPEQPELPAGLEALEESALRRPDVEATRVNLELARGTRSSVLWRYAPNVGLSAAYRWSNVTGFTGEASTWLVTLGLNWTLWDGGLREAELRESNARIAEAEANALAAENRARDEVRRGLLDLASARANRSKAEEQLQLARESQRLVDVNFRAGVATYLEVADANTALLAAETGFVGETLNASLAALRVLKAAGRFAEQDSR